MLDVTQDLPVDWICKNAYSRRTPGSACTFYSTHMHLPEYLNRVFDFPEVNISAYLHILSIARRCIFLNIWTGSFIFQNKFDFRICISPESRLPSRLRLELERLLYLERRLPICMNINKTMYIYIYVYTCIHTYICIYIYIYTHTCYHTCIYMYICMYRERAMYVCMYVYVCIYAYVWIYIYIYM